ncbi:MAG: YbaB/EbfC family nucleoid-associated protein [Firmicutes bacterium]|nr:YbaB/EbfC family nucleoid-associated protein [Bacillota bacterium]
MMNMAKMMRQVQKMQAEMARIQEELASKTVEATAGGGMVTAVVNGHQDLVSLRIDPQAVDPQDVEMLQDMVLAAVNEALRRAREMASQEMARVTGGLNIPGLPGL